MEEKEKHSFEKYRENQKTRRNNNQLTKIIKGGQKKYKLNRKSKYTWIV